MAAAIGSVSNGFDVPVNDTHKPLQPFNWRLPWLPSEKVFDGDALSGQELAELVVDLRSLVQKQALDVLKLSICERNTHPTDITSI